MTFSAIEEHQHTTFLHQITQNTFGAVSAMVHGAALAIHRQERHHNLFPFALLLTIEVSDLDS